MNKKIFCAFLFSLLSGALLYLVRSGTAGVKPFPLYYFVLAFAVAVCFVLSFFLLKESDFKSGADASGEPVSVFSKTFAVISAFLLCAAAVLLFISDPVKKLLSIVLSVFLLFCALSLILRVKYSDSSDKCRIFSLFPVYYSCFYLLILYRANASVLPEVSSFSPEIFLLISLIFTAYFSSASLFGKSDARIRCGVTLTFVSLSFSELLSAVFSPDLFPVVSSLSFICMVIGFALFYSSDLTRSSYVKS